METVWDWVTVFGFAGLVTLLLQRSAEEEPRDELWQYAPPALGFAVVLFQLYRGWPPETFPVFKHFVAWSMAYLPGLYVLLKR